jgi:hypothetical protein
VAEEKEREQQRAIIEAELQKQEANAEFASARAGWQVPAAVGRSQFDLQGSRLLL